MPVTAHDRPIDSEEEVIEIRLSDIVTFLKRSRRAILIGAFIGGLIGALYAFSKPNEFTSQLTVLPELQTKGNGSLGGLSSLAGLAGIDVNSLGGGTDAVRPELYPTVLQSVQFALEIAQKPIYSKDYKRTERLETYLNAKNELGWFSRLFTNAKDSANVVDWGPRTGTLQLTKQQDELTKSILERIVSTYDKKSGVLTIGATMPDPFVAATTTQQTLLYLTNYITGYRTEKARLEVDFLTKQAFAAKKRYQQAEYTLSAYRDQNRSVYQNTAKIEEQRIQAEFLLAQDLYNTLSKQAEMAKIRVQQDTPVFKVLEPAQIPLKKSGPKRMLIILGIVVLGSVIGLISSFFHRDQ